MDAEMPRYRFGPNVFDVDARELVHDGERADIEPGTFAVLTYLIEHRHRVVPKEELLDEVWGDRFVSESTLTTRIKQARAAVGDDGRSQHTIRTMHRVGYRFVADLEEIRPTARHPEPGQSVPVLPPWSVSAVKAEFGRDDDVAAVARRLTEHRLVTVIGPAGVGKTSLCQRILVSDLATPVANRWFCELADTRDPETVVNVVLAALGEAQLPGADPTESLVRVLEDRADLLVFDNCEHVTGAAAALARRIVTCCPGVGVLATSREPLGLREETVYSLEPLDLDDAVRCFTARAADAGAHVDPADPALRELCRRLDGLPLAIELAAARARLLSPAEMLELLPDRFRLLRDAEGGDIRHASLHAAIDSSWDALTVDDRRLLSRMGVFVGPFTLEDMRRVALDGADRLDAVDALARLVRQSLVVASQAPGGRNRFRLLESVRDFALEHLADERETRAAHLRHFARRAEELDAACQTPEVDTALAEMREIWDNLRAAVSYAAAAGDIEAVRRIVVAVAEYADLFFVHEVLDWCRHAALDGHLGAGSDVRHAAEALAVQARILTHQGHHQEALDQADRALSLHESHATLLSVVWCAYNSGDLELVIASAPRLLDASRSERGLDRGSAEAFAALVVAASGQADIASTAVTPADAERGVLGALDALTEGLRLCAAKPDRAAPLLEAVVEASIRYDYRLLLGVSASTLTYITLPARPPAEALQTMRRTLARYREHSMWNMMAADMVMVARLLAEAGDGESAARLMGARLESGYAVGLSEALSGVMQHDLRAALGDSYDELIRQGRRLRPPAASDVAMEALSRALVAVDA